MFILNRGYQWTTPDFVDGVIIKATGIDQEMFVRRDTSEKFNCDIYFDPQLYMSDLSFRSSAKYCARLASYDYLPCEVPVEYDSQELNLHEWNDILRDRLESDWPPSLPSIEEEIKPFVESCVEFQKRIGVSSIIFPTPLEYSPLDENADIYKWITVANDCANSEDMDCLATIALDSNTLIEEGSGEDTANRFADEISANRNLDGAYVVVQQSDCDSLRITDKEIASFFTEISKKLGRELSKKVFVNFVGELGLVCSAYGAEAFACGSGVKDKRLSLSDYVDRRGQAYPKFYSHDLISELSIDHLDVVSKNRLGFILENSYTSYSQDVKRAINAGDDPSEIPDWKHDLGNTTTSNEHYIKKLSEATNDLSNENEPEIKARNWLVQAEGYLRTLNSRIEENYNIDHIRAWQNALP